MNEFEMQTTTKSERKLSTTAKILLTATGGVALGLTLISSSFIAPAFRRYCLPYVPATDQQITNVLSFLPKNAKGKLLDIGSGDGRIVIAAAKERCIKSDGVELNPWLVYFSRLAALRGGVSQQTRFFRKDLWKFNTNPYNYVVIFGVDQMMLDIEAKLLKESPSNAKIIACRFPLPTLEPIDIIDQGVDTVWYYDLSKIKTT